jgi:hypothetical protein
LTRTIDSEMASTAMLLFSHYNHATLRKMARSNILQLQWLPTLRNQLLIDHRY